MELLHFGKVFDFQLKKHLKGNARYFDHCKRGERFGSAGEMGYPVKESPQRSDSNPHKKRTRCLRKKK